MDSAAKPPKYALGAGLPTVSDPAAARTGGLPSVRETSAAARTGGLPSVRETSAAAGPEVSRA